VLLLTGSNIVRK